MSLKENIKEWFSTIIGALLFIVLIVNFFTNWPQELTLYQQLGALVLAGVFLFGNPKAFFARLEKLLTKKIDR